ncbi:MAG TPA: hypothetical protein DCR40_16195 [Prolixibacteraceae bacterium]|nr:hypothetical protein [Prolixibacteraceae bacterium]
MDYKTSPRTRKEIIIDDLTTFKEWTNSLRKIQFDNELRTYIFNLSEFSPDENQKISDQVNGFHNACGCETGSIFMNLTLVIMVAGYFISGGKITAITLHEIVWCAGITLFAALTGKGIGLFRARRKLINLSRHLHERLNINTLKQIRSY